MLAGEPPVTGASAQSMIAKLLTEKPTRVRVLRDSVPPSVDEAISKALSKTPADRFTSAGEFVRSLERAPTAEIPSAEQAPARKKNYTYAGLAAVLVVALLAAAVAMSGKFKRHEDIAVLGRKTQLTTSGEVLQPAISPDGKQLTYVTKHCGSTGCLFDVVVQDVGGTATRKILEGATASYGMEWSPDRRNIAFAGTIGRRSGVWLLSALGTAPRFLTAGAATFYAGGDSLLLGPLFAADSVFWVRVTSLDGVVHDSIRVPGPGNGLNAISSIPGTNFILSLVVQGTRGLWQVMDRSGKIVDHVVNACTCGGLATSDAVWLARAGDTEGEAIVRIAIDRATGHLAARQDTMASGLFTSFSVTEDGSGMLMDQGTYEHNLWALDVPEILKGNFPEDRHIVHSSSAVSGSISPDGSRLLLRRIIPVGEGKVETRASVMPFSGGAETAIPGVGTPRTVFWTDSVTVATASLTPTGLHFAELDVRSGARKNEMDIRDSLVAGLDVLPDGWIWIPPSRDRFVLSEHGKRREIKQPSWFGMVARVNSDLKHNRVVFIGYNKSTGDSLGVGTISLADGSITQWASMFAESAGASSLDDGTLSLRVNETQESIALYRMTAPGKLQRIGASPRPLINISVSGDMKRGVVYARDYRADAWLSQVVRPQQ
jgi:hypothetical protein